MWHDDFNNAEGLVKTSLKNLQLDYVDTYLLHWPLHYYTVPRIPMHKLWHDMEQLVDKKYTKSIGLCNFNVQLIWDILTYARHKPVINQVELNLQCQQPELVRFLHGHNIVPMAYIPIARPGNVQDNMGDPKVPDDWVDFRENEYLKQLAKKYNKTVVQVMLNWGLCKGHCVIPMAAQLNW